MHIIQQPKQTRTCPWRWKSCSWVSTAAADSAFLAMYACCRAAGPPVAATCLSAIFTRFMDDCRVSVSSSTLQEKGCVCSEICPSSDEAQNTAQNTAAKTDF